MLAKADDALRQAAEQTQSHKSIIDELQTAQSLAARQIEAQASRLTQAAAELETEKHAHTAAKNDIAALEDQLAQSIRRAEALDLELAAARNELNTARQQNEQQSDEITRLGNALDEATHSGSMAGQNLAAFTGQIKVLEQQLGESKSKIDEAHGQIAQLQEQLRRQNESLNQTQDMAHALEEEKMLLAAQLQQRIQAHDEQVARLREAIDQQGIEHSDTLRQVDAVMENERQARIAAQDALAGYNGELEHLRRRLAEMTDEKETALRQAEELARQKESVTEKLNEYQKTINEIDGRLETESAARLQTQTQVQQFQRQKTMLDEQLVAQAARHRQELAQVRASFEDQLAASSRQVAQSEQATLQMQEDARQASLNISQLQEVIEELRDKSVAAASVAQAQAHEKAQVLADLQQERHARITLEDNAEGYARQIRQLRQELETLRRAPETTASCDMCGKADIPSSSLEKIDSGHQLCPRCIAEMRG
jgi:chromosome segregation ATPase